MLNGWELLNYFLDVIVSTTQHEKFLWVSKQLFNNDLVQVVLHIKVSLKFEWIMKLRKITILWYKKPKVYTGLGFYTQNHLVSMNFVLKSMFLLWILY